MKTFKVKDNPSLIRDGYSKAIINTDLSMLQEHRRKQKTMQNINELNSEINNLKSDIEEIKSMLTLLLKK